MSKRIVAGKALAVAAGDSVSYVAEFSSFWAPSPDSPRHFSCIMQLMCQDVSTQTVTMMRRSYIWKCNRETLVDHYNSSRDIIGPHKSKRYRAATCNLKVRHPYPLRCDCVRPSTRQRALDVCCAEIRTILRCRPTTSGVTSFAIALILGLSFKQDNALLVHSRSYVNSGDSRSSFDSLLREIGHAVALSCHERYTILKSSACRLHAHTTILLHRGHELWKCL